MFTVRVPFSRCFEAHDILKPRQWLAKIVYQATCRVIICLGDLLIREVVNRFGLVKINMKNRTWSMVYIVNYSALRIAMNFFRYFGMRLILRMYIVCDL